jgi:hypothetical protein
MSMSLTDALADALERMTQTFIDGSHYETCNPYSRPYVRDAQAALREYNGAKREGWTDARTAVTYRLAAALRAMYDSRPKGDVAFAGACMQAVEALYDFDTQTVEPEDDPAAVLVHAFAAAKCDGGHVDWSSIEAAHAAARKLLGESRCAEIEALYAEIDAAQTQKLIEGG